MKIVVTDCTLFTFAFVLQLGVTLKNIISKLTEPDGGEKHPYP
jgi:hypothetical protein